MVLVLGGAVLLLVGVALLVVGVLGLTGRLPRNRWAGVRTPGSLASAQAFTLANRAAGPGVTVGGALVALAGVALVGLDGALRPVAVVLLALGGAALVVAAGALGARATPALVPAGPHARCADCTGCELMDSLRA